jgi:hypothetical protein
MEGQHHETGVVGQLYQREAQRRRLAQIEAAGAIRLEVSVAARRVLRDRDVAPVVALPFDRRCLAHDLERLLLLFPDEHAPQDAVAIGRQLPGALERRLIEPAARHPAQLLDVQPRHPVVQAVEEHPLLHRREGIDRFDVLAHAGPAVSESWAISASSSS